MRSRTNFFSTSFLLILLGLIFSTNLAFAACQTAGYVAVPNVIGKTQAAATTAIGTATLSVGTITQQVTTTNPAGTVINQSPSPSSGADPDPTCVAPGTAVSLTVAVSPVTVPNVVGLSQSAATAALTAVGLTAGTVTSQNSTSVPSGTVLSQNPAAGATANPGAAVALVVATGSTLVTVPNVVGSTQTSATLAIEGTCSNATTPSVCLTVGTVTQQVSATIAAGQVISQSPAANIPVEAGTAVNIWVSSGTGISVPTVTGKPQATAETTLTNAGLTIGTVTQAFSATVSAGNVISQNPEGGTTAARGTAVNLVISSGVAPFTVPNVVGLTLSKGQDAITGVENANFQVGTISLVSSDTISAGIIMAQSPTGGTAAASGSTINLTVSSGPAAPEVPEVTPGDIEVPDVIGMTKTGASDVIRGAGLTVGATILQYSDTVPAGSVIDQSPAAGTLVITGTAVSLTVSRGAAGTVTVPNVIGQSEAIAQALLQAAGLTIGTSTEQPDTTTPVGNIIATTPEAGEQVAAGSAVDLVVSTGFSSPQQCTVPDVTNQTVDIAREILFATCLAGIGSTSVQQSSTVAAGLISAQYPTAGSSIGYNTTVNLVISSGSQPPVDTPRVVGMTLADATIVIENVGLKVGFISYQTHNTVENGRIISQNPLMTASAPIGWAVNLVISLGPVPEDPGASPQTLVPDVANLTLAAATSKLIEAGLRVGMVSNQRNSEVPAGQIVGQSPLAGETVAINSRIKLTVSFGPYAYSQLSGPAYITNYYGNTVSILDPDTSQVVDNMPAGISNNGPSGIAVSPDGTKLYVTNRPQYARSAGTVTVIDLTQRQVIANIPVGVAPLGIAVNPTGERVFVANEGSFSLSVIDTTTNLPIIDMNVPNLAANPYPRGVATHPNPLRPLVYVTNRTVNSFSDDASNPYPDQCDGLVSRAPVNVNPDQCVGSLSIFDADLKTQVGSVAVGWAPEGVAVHPDGMLVYVANSGDGTVSVIETVFNRVIGVIALNGFGGATQPLVPRGVAVSPDGNRLYVTDGGGNRLFVIDTTANHSVVDIIPVGRKPYGVAVSPDSKQVYVANTDDNTVSIIRTSDDATIAVVPVVSGTNVNSQWAPWAFGQFVGPMATVATPTFDPLGGLLKTVQISTTTAGASISYTTDGSLPSRTNGTIIQNGDSVSLTTLGSITVVLRAIAFKDNWADSAVVGALYSSDPSQLTGGNTVSDPSGGPGGKSPGEM